MTRKWMIVLTGFIFACSTIFLMTSCAQKQVAVETAPTPPKSSYNVDQKSKEMEEKARRDYEEKLKERQRKKAEEERQRQAEMAGLNDQISAFESQNIHFDFDRAELKPEARELLKKKAEFLKAHPEFSLSIEGYCDERGTAEYNIALGERRANAAWKYLNALGISGDRMDTVSYGEERPIDPAHNEAAWSKNRRDEFKLIKK